MTQQPIHIQHVPSLGSNPYRLRTSSSSNRQQSTLDNDRSQTLEIWSPNLQSFARAFLQPFVEYFPLFSEEYEWFLCPSLVRGVRQAELVWRQCCESSSRFWRKFSRLGQLHTLLGHSLALEGPPHLNPLKPDLPPLLLLHPAPLLLPHPGSNFPKARVTGPRVTSPLEIPELETCSLKQLQPSPFIVVGCQPAASRLLQVANLQPHASSLDWWSSHPIPTYHRIGRNQNPGSLGHTRRGPLVIKVVVTPANPI